jgi:succinate dehydrogenase / fumarate reductase iron-sulfur subunit
MNLKLKIWRQDNTESAGQFKDYEISDVSPDSSFLEMLDLLNEQLVEKDDAPVAFDHDCREGVCGMCSLTINGLPHGGDRGTTTCQLHMRHFNDGDTITIEPFRAAAFPVQRDLIVDRSGFDKIIQAGGFITARTGSCQDANTTPIPKSVADKAFDYAACIGCGACVASCKNASAMLFTGAKISHMNILPQGKAEKDRRTLAMVAAMDEAGFGNCRNYGECSAACPKEIPLDVIARMNRDYAVASVKDLIGI